MKTVARMTGAVFLLLIFGFSFAFWALPDRAFSERENRGLQTLPRFSLSALVSGAFSKEVDDYFADQLPMRETLVFWKGCAERALGKGENNGILFGNNGYLARRKFDIIVSDGGVFEDSDVFDAEQIASACRGIQRVSERLPNFFVLLTGRNLDVVSSEFDYPQERSDALLQGVREKLSDVDWIETVSVLREKHGAGEQIYYKTDHHWTTRGAYYAYCEIMRAFGQADQILSEDSFQKQTVSDTFLGSLWSAGGMPRIGADTVEIWTLGDEEEYLVTADGRETDGFYEWRRLEGRDHYAIFLDGTHDVVTVTKRTGEKRPVLLLVKDSFANSLAPFLARHYDLVLLNLSSSRKDFTSVTEQAERYGADRVLLVYTLENLLTADKLGRLK